MLDYKILEFDHSISYGSVTLKSLQNDSIPELDLLVREAIQNSSDAGCIFYKEYHLDSIPGDEVLLEDLDKFINIYKNYHSVFVDNTDTSEHDAEKEGVEDMQELDIKGILAKIKTYIFARGFDYPDGLIENFYLSLCCLCICKE